MDVKSIMANGDGGANEPGMSGLNRAVTTIYSLPTTDLSVVLLFTDENPQNPDMIDTVLPLILSHSNGIEVHFFLPPHLPRSVNLSCLQRANSLPVDKRLLAKFRCRTESVQDYVEIATRTNGSVTDSLDRPDTLSTFARMYNTINPGALGDLMCSSTSRRRRASTSCERFSVSEFATALTAVIEAKKGSVRIVDPQRNTQKTVTSIEIFTQSNPKAGIWSACPQGTGSEFTFEKSIRNDFQYTVQFLMAQNGVASILSSPPPPGCKVTVLIVTPQLRNLSSNQVQRLAVVSLAGEVIQLVNLERCRDNFLTELVVPLSTFSFRFEGVTVSAIPFQSAQTPYYEPEQWRLVVTEVHAPQQISINSTALYKFSVRAENKGNCSVGIRIETQVVTADPEVTLTLSPQEVTVSGVLIATFHVEVYVGIGAIVGQNQIELSLYIMGSSTLLKRIHSRLGIEVCVCVCVCVCVLVCMVFQAVCMHRHDFHHVELKSKLCTHFPGMNPGPLLKPWPK